MKIMMRNRLGACLLVTLIACFVGLTTRAQQKGDVEKQDFSKELPRIPGKTPKEAMQTFQIHPDFRLQLVASEPLIRDPVAMDFDENGVLFVAEYPEYNQINRPDFKEHGSIKRLEDADGDGVYDRATVFVDKLDSPVAVACYDGGIFVGAVPDILYYKDTDGDGKADVRKVIYTGFAKDKAGEAMLNSFRWGMDNRFHISTSLAGGDVRPANDKDARPVSIRRQGFVFDPRTLNFEITSGGGQHGMSMDDWGQRFVCDNSTPFQTIMYDGHYTARNPYLQTPTAAISVNAEDRYAKLFRISPSEPWRVVRTRLRVQGAVRGPVEAGKPSGYFTGATGVTVYRGDAWPKEYHGNIFVGDVSNNLVYRGKLSFKGIQPVVSRADMNQEFLASRDIWFRPAQLANSPDGNLYVIDMYRELIETVVSIPDFITKHLDTTSGVDRGRIYRIVHKNSELRPMPKLGKASTRDLVALLEHANGWHRDTASRLLYERQDKSAVSALRKMAKESPSPLGRAHALHTLNGLNALTAEDVLPRLRDTSPKVRVQALRLAEQFASHPQVMTMACQMADDADPSVRYQLAFSLGAFATGKARNAIVQLAFRDADDSWMRLALLSSTRKNAGDCLQQILISDKKISPGLEKMTLDLVRQIGTANQSNEIAMSLRALQSLPRNRNALREKLLQQLLSKMPAATRKTIQDNGALNTVLVQMIAKAQQVAMNEKASDRERSAAIRTLGLSKFASVQEIFQRLLRVDQSASVQKATLETVTRFEDREVADLIIDAWPTLSPQVRLTAAEALFSRPNWTMSFLDAVEKSRIKTGEIDPARVALLQASGSQDIRKRASELFSETKLSRRADVLARYRKALAMMGDAKKGKVLFKKHCTSCHQLEGIGQTVGADLSAIGDKGSETILMNVLDPNKEVKPQFVSYVVVTNSGRVVTGMITAETAGSLTIRRADGMNETILRVNIDELRSTGMSFMPEGLEQQISIPDMADLLAYLNQSAG